MRRAIPVHRFGLVNRAGRCRRFPSPRFRAVLSISSPDDASGARALHRQILAHFPGNALLAAARQPVHSASPPEAYFRQHVTGRWLVTRCRYLQQRFCRVNPNDFIFFIFAPPH